MRLPVFPLFAFILAAPARGAPAMMAPARLGRSPRAWLVGAIMGAVVGITLTVVLAASPERRTRVVCWLSHTGAGIAERLAAAGSDLVDVPFSSYCASPDAAPAGGAATLQVRGVPADAVVMVDGHIRGRTPLEVSLPSGQHEVRVSRSGFVDGIYQVNLEPGAVAPLHVDLWRTQPLVARVRPSYPGASIADAQFLADGSLALGLAFPGRDERQLWHLTLGGGSRQVGPKTARGPMAISPNGARVAYLSGELRATSVTPGAAALTDVWVSGQNGEQATRVFALPSASGERLQDVRWAPDGRHLLVVTRQAVSGGAPRTRLLWRDVGDVGDVDNIGHAGDGSAGPVELVSLPAEVVVGSVLWNPDGQRVAFLTRSGQLASLCVLEPAAAGAGDGGFRYVADLGPAPGPQQPLPWAPPVAWSPDGRSLAYAAPPREGSKPASAGNLLATALGPSQKNTRGALYLINLAHPAGQAPDPLLLESPDGAPLWPAWRPEQAVVALTRTRGKGASGSGLALARAAPPVSGSAETPFASVPLAHPVPAAKGAAFAVLWDVAHGQALLALSRTEGAGGQAAAPEFWLLRFRASGSSEEGQR